MDKRLFLGGFKWLMTRTGIWYLILFFVVLGIVDARGLSDRLKISQMNYLRPSFSEFSSYLLNGVAVPDWKPYRRYFEVVLSNIPNEPTTHLALGYVHYQEGRLKDAHDEFLASLNANPTLFWNAYSLGIMAFQKGDHPGAEKYLMQALRFPPDIVVRSILESIVYRQILSGLLGPYILTLRVVAAQNDATVLLLANYLKGGKPQAALSMAKGLIDKGNIHDLAPVFFYAGQAALELGQFSTAADLLERSLQVDPKNPLAYAFLAEIADKAGKNEHSLDWRKKAILLKGQFGDRYPYDRMFLPRIL